MEANRTHMSAQPNLGPSDWVLRFGGMVPSGGRVLDVACGRGRHANWFADRGYRVHAVDREPAKGISSQIDFQQADIEAGPWPYVGQVFEGVVVTNYLHRPLMQILVGAVAKGGWMIYETFAEGNEKFGRPTRADFLLEPGELLEVVRGRFRVIAYEHVVVKWPKSAVVQRIAAQRID